MPEMTFAVPRATDIIAIVAMNAGSRSLGDQHAVDQAAERGCQHARDHRDRDGNLEIGDQNAECHHRQDEGRPDRQVNPASEDDEGHAQCNDAVSGDLVDDVQVVPHGEKARRGEAEKEKQQHKPDHRSAGNAEQPAEKAACTAASVYGLPVHFRCPGFRVRHSIHPYQKLDVLSYTVGDRAPWLSWPRRVMTEPPKVEMEPPSCRGTSTDTARAPLAPRGDRPEPARRSRP